MPIMFVLYQYYLTIEQEDSLSISGWETMEIHAVRTGQVFCFDLPISKEAVSIANFSMSRSNDLSIVKSGLFTSNVTTIAYYECVER